MVTNKTKLHMHAAQLSIKNTKNVKTLLLIEIGSGGSLLCNHTVGEWLKCLYNKSLHAGLVKASNFCRLLDTMTDHITPAVRACMGN